MILRLLIIFMLLVTNLSGCKKAEINSGDTAVANLPDYLEPLDGAFDISCSPDNTSLVYMVNESYPAEKTIALLEKQLQKNGFVKLERSLLSANTDKNLSWQEDKRKDTTLTYRREEWINPEGKLIRVSTAYLSMQSKVEAQLMVELTTYSGWEVIRLIQQYIKLNPEEFARMVDSNLEYKKLQAKKCDGLESSGRVLNRLQKIKGSLLLISCPWG